MIKYSIHKNMVSDNPSDYYGRPSIASSKSIDDIVDRMLQQGSTVTRPDILAVIENAVKAAENLLLEGNRVNFGDLVQLYPRIRGSFEGQTDSFNRSRHRVDVGATAGTRTRISGESIRAGRLSEELTVGV